MYPRDVSSTSFWGRVTAYLALAWALVSFIVHTYWIAGGTGGLGGRRVQGVLGGIDVIAIVLSAAAALIALALVRPSWRRRRRWLLLTVTWIGIAAVGLRGVVGIWQEIFQRTGSPVAGPVADWFYFAGAILFGAAVIATPGRAARSEAAGASKG